MSSLEQMNKVLGDVSFFLEQNGIEPQPSYNQNRVSDYFVLISFTGSLYFAKSKGKDTQKNWHKVCRFSLYNDGDDGATKTSLKKWSRAASNCIALIPSCSTRQMLAIFLELNFKRLYQSSGKLGKKKVIVLCWRPSQNVKLGIFTS